MEVTREEVSLVHLGHDRLAEIGRDEFDPRVADICPECGSGHTRESRSKVFYCDECNARWHVCDELCRPPSGYSKWLLQDPKLSDKVEP